MKRLKDEPVDLVERHHERGLALLQQVDGLDGLRLQPVHNVDDEDGDVAEGRAPRAQVGEALVPGRVDDEQTGDPDLLRVETQDHLALLLDGRERDVSGADLLRDPASLALLHVRPAQLVQDLCLAGVHVPEDADDGLAEHVRRALGFVVATAFLVRT